MPDRTAPGAELLLIRHAPADHGNRMTGRRDVPLILPAEASIAATRRLIGPVDSVVSSPALRCRQTAEALFPDQPATADPRLWEQDFGAWDGMAFADLPDIGTLDRAALACHCPPGGESFSAMYTRCKPALTALGRTEGRIALVVHAGTIRAALSLALEDTAAGLAFEIAPLSLTRIRCLGGDGWSIGQVNCTPHQ